MGGYVSKRVWADRDLIIEKVQGKGEFQVIRRPKYRELLPNDGQHNAEIAHIVKGSLNQGTTSNSAPLLPIDK